jgi:hypothetical protein
MIVARARIVSPTIRGGGPAKEFMVANFLADTRIAARRDEARGFHPIRFTDGADNEERMPDVRYLAILAIMDPHRFVRR